MDLYQGVDLAPNTLESLVTWDVSGHARREQDRLRPGSRPSKATQDRLLSGDEGVKAPREPRREALVPDPAVTESR